MSTNKSVTDLIRLCNDEIMADNDGQTTFAWGQRETVTAIRDALAAKDAPALEAVPVRETFGEEFRYAKNLANAIWRKNYKDTAPEFKPLNDMYGVLSQIDNMTCGMSRTTPARQEAAPLDVPEELPFEGAVPCSPAFIEQRHQWQTDRISLLEIALEAVCDRVEAEKVTPISVYRTYCQLLNRPAKK